MKSYNVQALRGNDYDDRQFQKDMEGTGINIPDSLLYKPELGPYVINQVHQQSLSGLPSITNPQTGKPFTSQEAREVADKHRSDALEMYNTLLKG